MDVIYYCPPDLLLLLVDTIDTLHKGKLGVIQFFRGAGVGSRLIDDLEAQVRRDRESIKKREIAQQFLVEVNEGGDTALRQLREIVKRVVEWEDFSTCYDDKRLEAQGLVAQVRKQVQGHDTLTRIDQDRETQRSKHQAAEQARLAEIRQRKEQWAALKGDFGALFGITNPQQRGKRSEDVLNRLFELGDIGRRRAFALSGEAGEGIVEQIDGLVDIDGRLYLVEMKRWKTLIGRPEAAELLLRLNERPDAHGIFISASGYTDAAIDTCKKALLRGKVVVLCELREIHLLIEQQADLREFLRKKIQAAIVDRNPYHT
jgi:restriction system protein